MEICNIKKLFIIFLTFLFTNSSLAEINFKNLGEKKVSYLDFFLLKFENQLIRRSQFLRTELFATRVQYNAISIEVNFDKKNKRIFTDIYAVMDKRRYSKKNYKQKLSDCNQIRNVIFYKKKGYKFFTQKRDPRLSISVMENIFKNVFFNNLSFSEEEINFLLNSMFIKVTIYHPVNKNELICSGKINDYELN